jgi:hypothetical protein
MNTPAWDRAGYCFNLEKEPLADMADKATWVSPEAVPSRNAPLSQGALELLIQESQIMGNDEEFHKYTTQLAILQAGETTLETLEQ